MLAIVYICFGFPAEISQLSLLSKRFLVKMLISDHTEPT